MYRQRAEAPVQPLKTLLLRVHVCLLSIQNYKQDPWFFNLTLLFPLQKMLLIRGVKEG